MKFKKFKIFYVFIIIVYVKFIICLKQNITSDFVAVYNNCGSLYV